MSRRWRKRSQLAETIGREPFSRDRIQSGEIREEIANGSFAGKER